MRVSAIWLEYMNTGKPIVDAKFISAARPMVPLIEAAAAKHTALANMNRTVHLPTYNKLIAEAAARKAAGPMTA